MLATKIPERKFDFSLDYEVINELALALYARAMDRAGRRAPSGAIISRRRSPPIAARWRSIPKTSTAHYGLGLAYGDAAWGEQADADGCRRSRRDGKAAEPVDRRRRSLKLRGSIADPKAPRREAPVASALRLAGEIARFMDGPRPRYQSRLEPLHEVVEILGPGLGRARPIPTRDRALARALEVDPQRLHERLKPDETAEGRAFAAGPQAETRPPTRTPSRS